MTKSILPHSLRHIGSKRPYKRYRGTSFEDFFDDQPNPTRHEQALWRAVIMQMICDAVSQSRKPEARHQRREALAWLNGYSRDFRTVCELAGLEPQYIFQHLQRILKQQKPLSADKLSLRLRECFGATWTHHSGGSSIQFTTKPPTLKTMRISLQPRERVRKKNSAG